MILLSYVSWGVLAYVLVRFVLPLGCGWPGKALLALLFALVSSKYEIYEWSSGQFFAPDLPRWAILLLEMAYAALVLLFLLLLLRDVGALLLWLMRLCGWRGADWPGWLPLRTQRLGLAALALCCAVWGVWQGVRVPDVRLREITLPDAAPALDGLRVVHLTDLHIGPLLKRDWLDAVVRRVNALEADVVVITGDFIDGFPERLRPDLAPLATLKARHGVYGVTGNHEYLYGVQDWLNTLQGMGVRMLNNTHVLLEHNGAQLVLAGVTDPRARRMRLDGPKPTQALAGAPDAAAVPRVLLAHQPRTLHANRQAAGRLDVQLSGHTHGGLMFFLQPIIARFNEGFVRGLYRVGETWLHVSPGTALWNGFSCRLGVPAEISLLVLRTGGKP